MTRKHSVLKIVLLCTAVPVVIIGAQLLIFSDGSLESWGTALTIGIILSIGGGIWAMTRGGKLPPAQQPPERDK